MLPLLLERIIRFHAQPMLLKHIHVYSTITRPRVHKAFQNKDQDQAQVKIFLYYGLFLKPTIII